MTVAILFMILILLAFGADFMVVPVKVDKVEGNTLYVNPLWCQGKELVLEVEKLDLLVKPGDKVSFVTEVDPCSVNRIKVKKILPGGRR